MFTRTFWKDAAERAVKTFAQALLALLLVAPNTPLIAFDWTTMALTAATAAVISVLTSIVGGKAVDSTVSPASVVKD